MALISQVITSGSQATVTFSSLAGYTDLFFSITARDTSTGVSDSQIYVQINGDATSGNYTGAQQAAGLASAASATLIAATANGNAMGSAPGTSGNANAVGTTLLTIPNYLNTTFNKMMLSELAQFSGASPDNRTVIRTGTWKSTASITSVKFTAGTTAFLNGSIFNAWGR
jgi:hypothetical protein